MVVTGFWGLLDGVTGNILGCILGFQFDSQRVPFSANNFVMCVFIFIFIIAQSFFTSVPAQLCYIAFSLVLSIVSMMLLVTKFEFRENKPEK